MRRRSGTQLPHCSHQAKARARRPSWCRSDVWRDGGIGASVSDVRRKLRLAASVVDGWGATLTWSPRGPSPSRATLLSLVRDRGPWGGPRSGEGRRGRGGSALPASRCGAPPLTSGWDADFRPRTRRVDRRSQSAAVMLMASAGAGRLASLVCRQRSVVADTPGRWVVASDGHAGVRHPSAVSFGRIRSGVGHGGFLDERVDRRSSR
jgi:hypothetical protein